MPQVKEKREGIEEKVARIEGSQYELSKRIDDLKDNMNQRFHELRSDIDKRFGDMNKRFSLIGWTIMAWLSFLTFLTILFKFFVA